jgi:hypothetical protein
MTGVEGRLDGSTLVVRIPMRFQRRGGRKRIVAPDGSAIVPTKETAAGRHAGQGARARVAVAADAGRWDPRLDHGNLSGRENEQELCQPDPSARAAGTRHRRGDPRRQDGSGAHAGKARASAADGLGGAAFGLGRCNACATKRTKALGPVASSCLEGLDVLSWKRALLFNLCARSRLRCPGAGRDGRIQRRRRSTAASPGRSEPPLASMPTASPQPCNTHSRAASTRFTSSKRGRCSRNRTARQLEPGALQGCRRQERVEDMEATGRTTSRILVEQDCDSLGRTGGLNSQATNAIQRA